MRRNRRWSNEKISSSGSVKVEYIISINKQQACDICSTPAHADTEIALCFVIKHFTFVKMYGKHQCLPFNSITTYCSKNSTLNQAKDTSMTSANEPDSLYIWIHVPKRTQKLYMGFCFCDVIDMNNRLRRQEAVFLMSFMSQ